MKKRILSALLCLCMLMALLPSTALAAGMYADDNYGVIVRVADKIVTDGDEITYWTCSDNTLTRVYTTDVWNVKYDPTESTPTLTLNNFVYTGTQNGVRYYNDLKDIKIELMGTNTIINTKPVASNDATFNENHGIFVKNNLTITGTAGATLSVTSENGNGIMACHPSKEGEARHQESITIENANITAVATKGDVGIVASKSLTIADSVINSTGNNHGLQGGNFTSDRPGIISITNSTIAANATGTSSSARAFQSAPTVSDAYQWRSSSTGTWTADTPTSPTFNEKYLELKPGAPGSTTYAVTFAGGAGASGDVPTEGPHNAGDSFDLPAANALTNSGKTFIGWSDGTNSYLPGAAYTMPNHDVTLTAQWTASNPHAVASIKIADKLLDGTNNFYHNGTNTNLDGTADNISAGASAYFKDGVLVLNGLNVNNGKIWWDYAGNTADANDDLIIVLLSGSVNTVTFTAGSAIVGANGFAYGPSLTVRTFGSAPAALYAIGSSYGFWIWQDTTIEGSAKVIAQGDSNVGIATNTNNKSGVFTVKDSADVKAIGGKYGIAGDVTNSNREFASIQIDGGQLLAQGYNNQAMEKEATVDSSITSSSGSYTDHSYWIGTTGATRAAKPAATFTATGATNGKLSGVTNTMQYKLGYSDWVQITDAILTDGTITLTDLPSSGLTVSVQDTNGTPTTDDDSDVQVLTLNMTVPDYSIKLSQTTDYTFSAATVGYGDQTPLSVTVTNTGNTATGDLSVALSDADSFALNKTSIDSIAATSGTDTFTVRPKTGLAAGTYTATVTVSGANIVSKSFDVSFTVSNAALTGTAKITGEAKFGQTLTASLESGNNTGTLSYQWKRDGTVISGAAGSTYQLTADDIGKTITVDISSSVQTGTRTSAGIAVTKADQTAPAAPTMASKTSSSVTLTAITTTGEGTVEYAKNTANTAPAGGWQTGTEFTGLTANTTYYFFARYTGSNTHNPAVSTSIEITTDPLVIPVYSINLDKTGTQTFTRADLGYGDQSPLSVTVTNTGNVATGDLSVALSDADSFALNKTSIASIAATNGTDTFTVRPKTGLAAGTYTATVTVSGANIVSKSFDVSFTVNSLGDLETVTFNYAYDAQRGDIYPTQGQPINMTGLTNPLDANGNHSLESSGSWKLSKVGTYSYVKTNVQANNYLSGIVSGIAGNYSISDPDTIVIHELKNGDTHIAYGVVAAYDAAGGYALFLGDTWSNGACYLLSMNAISTESASITAGSILTDYISEADTYSISLSQTDAHTFPGVTVGYGEQTPLTVTVTNTGNAATGDLSVALSGDNADSFALNKTSIDSIAATNGTNTFTVRPKTGLAAGTYNTTVTVSGANIVSKSFDVSFTVSNAETYTVTWKSQDGASTLETDSNVAYDTAPSFDSTSPTKAEDSQYTYTFAGWATSENQESGTDAGSLPHVTADVTYYAAFSKTAKTRSRGSSRTPPSYKVEFPDSGSMDGTISTDCSTAKQGETVTIAVTPDPYYQMDGVVVKDQNGKKIPVEKNADGTFSFKMPAGKVTVEPIFSWDNPFADVDEDAYYAPAVEWALKNGITTGIGNATFSPDEVCTRAQVVSFLWRAAGSPAPKGISNNFIDVDKDAYYADAVLWAVEQGITNGTGGGKFSPDSICTRSQIVTFLYRAAGSPAVSGNASFRDVTADCYFADAVVWAEQNGITGGIGGGLFGAANHCTRAQILTFLYRFYAK